MSQIAGYIREKLNLTVHKIIFQKPLGDGKFIEVAQRYVSPTKTTFKLDKSHEYPFNAAQWTRQSKNRFIQYKDYVYLVQYDFYDAEHYQKPGARILQAVELSASKGAEVAKAVAQGGQLQAGVVLIILSVVVGLLGGVLLGLGQELNTTVYVSGVSGAYGAEPLIYDISGTAIAKVLENGTITAIYNNYGIINNIEPLSGGPAAGAAVLINSTAPYSWLLYWDDAQVHQILYTDLENLVVHGPSQVDTAKNYLLGGATGMFGLVGVLMVLAIGVGVRVLGIGVSEESVSTVLKGTGWTSIWLVFTALSYPLVFGTGEILLFILWFVLTVVFTLGCINSFGHPGND